MKEGCKFSCVKIFLAYLLESHYLFEILQISFTVINSENVIKSECFQWRAQVFFRNEGGTYIILRKNVNIW